MARRLAVHALAVLLILVGTAFVTAPGASASMFWVQLTGVTPTAMTATSTAIGSCTENDTVKACVAAAADPEAFYAKDKSSADRASAGIYVEVPSTGRRFACYHSFGASNIGKCATNVGEGNLMVIYALMWDRSIGAPPLYDRYSAYGVVA